MKNVFSHLVLAGCFFCLLITSTATAGGKIGLYGIRLVPYGIDAESYSRVSWGAGLHAVLPVKKFSNLVAGTVGLEFVKLQSETFSFRDPMTGLGDEQEGDPNYYRFYLGGQVGGHGNGFLRPHAGFDLALVYYHYVDGVVIYRKQSGQTRLEIRVPGNIAFGYDLSLGLDLNFSNTLALDGGVRYLKGLGVPQPVGDGSIPTHPQYFQIFLGIGYSIDFLNDDNEGE